jgi:formiminoglutamase
VIDVNRDPSGVGVSGTTGLLPLTDFDGQSIARRSSAWREIERRRATYHAPYHAALPVELNEGQALHGFAIL